jgi:hypothetical protein
MTAIREYNITLSRTGGQGSKGDSVTNAEIDNNGNLIITVTAANGTTTEINAGNLEANLQLNDLEGFTITNPEVGDVLLYGDTNTFENHKLTTSKVLDIDNTGKEDGATLVYDSTAGKYQATSRIEKSTTQIIGGSF